MENSRQKFHLRSKNVITFDSAYPIYPMAFSSTFSLPYRHPRIAVGSFIEEVNNCVDILAFDEDTLTLKPVPDLCFELPYPPTKLMFHPNPSAYLKSNDILASSGDHLRLWEVSDTSVEPPFTLSKNNPGEYFAPLTSFDWNEVEPRRIGTSSIDSSCTIWDVEKGAVESELIVHEKEVYDIAWGEAAVFASASADGSVRIFDLRDKKHSMVIYWSPDSNTPLRLAWNKQDLRYMATTLMDSNRIVILDVRSRAMPVAELEGHQARVNAIAWAPQSRRHICSAGDDGQALIWELPNKIAHMSSYSAGTEINQIHWSAAQCDWISIAFSNKLQLLRL